GALGFVIGLIGTLIMTTPDFIPVPELAVRASLWLWPVFALGISAAVVANLLIAPSDPEILLRAELVRRLRATEEALAGCLGKRKPEMAARTVATAGVTRMLALLKSAAVAHSSVKAQQAQYGALITLTDRLVTAAAALELASTTPLHADEHERLQHVAEDCARIRRVIEERDSAERRQPRKGSQSPVGGGSGRLAIIAELEHAADLLHQALAPEAVAGEGASSGAEEVRLFVPDALTNPEYIH